MDPSPRSTKASGSESANSKTLIVRINQALRSRLADYGVTLGWVDLDSGFAACINRGCRIRRAVLFGLVWSLKRFPLTTCGNDDVFKNGVSTGCTFLLVDLGR